MPVSRNLEQEFARHAVNNNLIAAGQKLVVAVSGGADSIALLHLLYRLKNKLELTLLAVHINHHLRGQDSDADAEFVKKLCNRLNITCVVKHIRLEAGPDLENRARDKRREILLQVLKSYKFDQIVLGHQKNDQAETVLMNLARGAGLTGLGGIRAGKDSFLRPLLAFPRGEIEAWLRDSKLEWREDHTNRETHFTRNRIRAELLPWLQSNLNQSVLEHLYQQAEILQQADDLIRGHIRRVLKKIILDDSNEHITLDLELLRQLSGIEQYYALRMCYSALSRTEQEFFLRSFREVEALFDSKGSKQVRLAHKVWVLKQYKELILTTTDPQQESTDPTELVIDAERTHFVFQNWRFTLKKLKIMPRAIVNTELQRSALIDLNKVELPLKMRVRQPADRFMPSGMKSEKKLKEFFIDEKVPQPERDKVPLLTDRDKIIWVVGYRQDARSICEKGTNKILLVTAEPVTTGRKRAASRAFSNTGEKNDLYEF